MKYFLLVLAFSSFTLNAEMLSRTKVLMGTFATVSLEEQDKSYFSPAFKELQAVEAALSSYKQDSPIYRLNHDKNATLMPYTYEALLLSKMYYEETDGYFNIAIGSVTKELYHFGEKQRVPTKKSLQKSDTSINSLRLNSTSVQLDRNVSIDLGGMGKGFGVDKATDLLKTQRVKKAIVALSGDIRCLELCKISIQNPFSESNLAAFETKKREMGISTSGNYNRYVESKEYNHLINPKTKESQKSFASITLISELSNSDLDAYATAASVMPKERAYAFLDTLELAYIVVEVDKRVVVSKNVDSFIKSLTFYNGAEK